MASFGLIKRFPNLSTLLALEFILLLILSYQVKVEPRVSLLEKTGLIIFGPIQALNQRVVGSVSHAVEDKKARAELIVENRRLRKKEIELEGLRTQFVETELENARFRELLDLPKEEEWRLVHAEVIGRTHRHNDYTIIINKGSRDGVRRDYGVIGPRGVVGIIWETSPGYAKILTMDNPSAPVAALLQESRFMESFVQGKGEGGSQARLKNFPNFETIRINDLVLTSGLDGIFPKGRHIGRVLSARASLDMFQTVDIKLSTDFARLESVTVLIPKCEGGFDELE